MENYVFDIDGTISESGKPISHDISEKIENLLNKGKNIIFASARPVRDILPMVTDRLRKEAIFIGCNGGMAFKNGSILYSRKINNDYVLSTIEILKNLNIPYVLDGIWSFSVSSEKHQFHDYIRSLSSEEKEEEYLLLDGITKILVLSNKENIDSLISTLSNENISIHVHAKEYIFDLTVKGNNKYQAILELVKGEYMAFGNDSNDFIMLDNAKYSVFIGSKSDYNNADIYLKFNEVSDFIYQISDNR